jgi:hypothetical protein
VTATVLAALLITLGGRGGPAPERGGGEHTGAADEPGAAPTRVPGVGDRLQRRVPAASRQVVAVYGDGRNSADATVVLYAKRGSGWERGPRLARARRQEGLDHRPPRGRQTQPRRRVHAQRRRGRAARPRNSAAVHPIRRHGGPRWWPRSYWHDFGHVIAIDHNRVEGTPPNNRTRPRGYGEGGGIWLHMDHGSGTSVCVSVSTSAKRFLLRTLDPDPRPVVVTGDRADLRD